MPARKIATDVSVFTIGSNALIGELVSATMEMTVNDQESKAVNEWWNDPLPVGAALRITGDLQVTGTVVLMGTAALTNPIVSFTANTGARTYSGTALLKTVSHRIERESIQTYSITLDSKGTVAVS